MSSKTATSVANLLVDVFKSNTFTKFSTMYVRYLKVTATGGFALGLIGASAYLLDCRRKNTIAKKRLMKSRKVDDEFELSDEDLDKYSITNFKAFSVLSAGVIGGTTFGVMWPAVVVAAPIYYLFGEYAGPIMSAILIASAAANENKNDAEKKTKKEE